MKKQRARARAAATGDCPCGSGKAFADCCAPLHAGEPAASAEALMRARYSAYVVGDTAFLLASWHASTRPQTLTLDAATRWLGLRVYEARMTGTAAAQVRFAARYREGGAPAVRMQECSRFVLEAGRWYYLDATHALSSEAAETTTSG